MDFTNFPINQLLEIYILHARLYLRFLMTVIASIEEMKQAKKGGFFTYFQGRERSISMVIHIVTLVYTIWLHKSGNTIPDFLF